MLFPSCYGQDFGMILLQTGYYLFRLEQNGHILKGFTMEKPPHGGWMLKGEFSSVLNIVNFYELQDIFF